MVKELLLPVTKPRIEPISNANAFPKTSISFLPFLLSVFLSIINDSRWKYRRRICRYHRRLYPRGACTKTEEAEAERYTSRLRRVPRRVAISEVQLRSLMHYSLSVRGGGERVHITRRVRISKSGLFDIYFRAVRTMPVVNDTSKSCAPIAGR